MVVFECILFYIFYLLYYFASFYQVFLQFLLKRIALFYTKYNRHLVMFDVANLDKSHLVFIIRLIKLIHQQFRVIYWNKVIVLAVDQETVALNIRNQTQVVKNVIFIWFLLKLQLLNHTVNGTKWRLNNQAV